MFWTLLVVTVLRQTYDGDRGKPNIHFKRLQKCKQVQLFFSGLLHQQADLEIHERLTEVHLQFPFSSNSDCSYGNMGSLKVQKCSSTVSTPDLTTVCSFGILKTRRGREGKEGLTKLIQSVL